MRLQSTDVKDGQRREWMLDKAKTMIFRAIMQDSEDEKLQDSESWVVDVLLPSLFTMLLMGCLIHLGYCMVRSQLEPVVRFHYAISAFPM